MAEVKWIKIATDIFDDEKIVLIESMPEADSIIVIWFKLLTLAGKQNNGGILRINDCIPYTDEMLATLFRRPLNTVRLALSIFEQYGMIEIVDETILLPNWEKHQNLEGLERIREQTRKRVAKYRERQKQKLLSGDVTLHVTHGNETEQEEEKEIEIDKEINSSRSVDDDDFTDIWHSLSIAEIDRLADLYEESCDLIQTVYEEVKLKGKIIKDPYRYIVGYAENVGWERNYDEQERD